MSDERDPDAHVDPISLVDAEAEAEVADLDHGVLHLGHREGDDPAVPGSADVLGGTTPYNPRSDHQRFLVAYLRVALVLAFVIGVFELALPEDLRDEAAIVMVGVFVIAPIGRIVWLMVRWVRRGDWRFALVGAVLLAVVATGFLAR